MWGSCFASAEELLFVEGQMLEDVLSYKLPCRVLVVGEGGLWFGAGETYFPGNQCFMGWKCRSEGCEDWKGEHQGLS